MQRALFALICLGLAFLSIPATTHSQTPTPQFRIIQTIQREPIPRVGGRQFREQIAFNPDGSQIAAAANDTTFSLWDTATGQIIHTVDFATTTITWSPDGQFIAAGASNTNIIGIWNADTALFIRNLFGLECSSLSGSLSWSPDNTKILTNCGEILDAQTSNLVAQLDQQWWSMEQMAWSPDGSMIATSAGYEDRLIHLFSLDGALIDTYWGDSSIAWSPDSTRLATTGQIREVENGLPVTIIPEMQYDIAWHPSGDWITSIGDEGDLQLWDVHSGDLVTSWQDTDCRISGFIWSANGERFAFSCIQFEPEFTTNLVIGELLR
jgi:WD40 repeat protein